MTDNNLRAQYETYRSSEMSRSFKEEAAIILPPYELWLEEKLVAIAAIERLPEDPTTFEFQHHEGFNDCVDIVRDILGVATDTALKDAPTT